MNYSDIFMQSHKRIYHMKRNEWYETKTYSDPAEVSGAANLDITALAPGLLYNYFLTSDGSLFMSEKGKPTQVFASNLKQKFKAIAAAEYFVGIGSNGRLYLWGKYG